VKKKISHFPSWFVGPLVGASRVQDLLPSIDIDIDTGVVGSPA
jgi:hypothetical protein